MLNDTNDANCAGREALTDGKLRSIVEEGFFGHPGSLAEARSACAELIFARAVIAAQTERIELLAGNP